MKQIILFLFSFVSFSIAAIPPVDGLEQILREKQDSMYSLQCQFDIQPEIIYPLKSKQMENRTDFLKRSYELIIEKGKYFTSKAELEPDRMQINYREAWNGTQKFSSSESPTFAKNVVSSNYSSGINRSAVYYPDFMGIMCNKIFGTYDDQSTSQLTKGRTPLQVLDRIKKTQGVEIVTLKEIEYKGRTCILMSLEVDEKYKAQIGINNPMAEHIIDPDLDFACVESKLYNLEGLLRTLIRNYEKNEDGQVVLVSGEIINTVNFFHEVGRHEYSKEDLGKLATVTRLTFNRIDINQPIEQSVYEEGNVFVLGGEIWDGDKGIKIQESLKAIQDQTLMSLKSADLLGQLSIKSGNREVISNDLTENVASMSSDSQIDEDITENLDPGEEVKSTKYYIYGVVLCLFLAVTVYLTRKYCIVKH